MRLVLLIVLSLVTELSDSIWSSMSVTGLPLEIFQLGFNIHKRARRRSEQKIVKKKEEGGRNKYVSDQSAEEEKEKLSRDPAYIGRETEPWAVDRKKIDDIPRYSTLFEAIL